MMQRFASLSRALRAPAPSRASIPLNFAVRRVTSSRPRPSAVDHAAVAAASAKSKPKPNKSPTSLKRTAAESHSIRANPTPTRGAIQPVHTFATAERYNLDAVLPHLPGSAQRFQDALWVALPEQHAEAWVYGNGTIVCWGLEEDGARDLVETIVAKASHAQFAPLKLVETEELDFVIDPNEETRLQGDLIILGRLPELADPSIAPASMFSSTLPSETLPARYAFSQALARSTALSALESSLDSFLTSVEALPQALSETGKPGLRRKELIQKLGHLLKFRQGVNLARENFYDTPDFYWAEPALEVYFNRMSEALEIRERINAVNRKITYASEVQVTLRELLTESSGYRMEIIIIALIAVEAAIAVIRDGPELWHMAFGDDESPKASPAH